MAEPAHSRVTYLRTFDDALRIRDHLRLAQLFARWVKEDARFELSAPVVMETMSVVAGLSTMRRATFLAASLAGTAPIVLVYAYAGAMSREVGSLLPAAVILVAVSGAGWLVYRSR